MQNVDMPERDVDILHQLGIGGVNGLAELDLDTLHRLRSGVFDWFRIKGVPRYFRPDQIRDFGLTPAQLPALVRCGAVERVGLGLYHVVNQGKGKHHLLAAACARSPGSIVCLHSALRVHGIKSEAAATVWLAIPHRARAPQLHDVSLRILRFSGTTMSLRVDPTEIDGVSAYITSPARTVADCFRLAQQAGAEAGTEAFRDALGKGLVTIEELARIEKALPCRRLRALLAWHAQVPPE
jgi:predicted transcriptional regulator of viral defense system